MFLSVTKKHLRYIGFMRLDAAFTEDEDLIIAL